MFWCSLKIFLTNRFAVDGLIWTCKMLKKFAAYTLIAIVSLGLDACTIVQIQGADPHTEFYPGLVRVNIHAARDTPTIVSTNGVGLVMAAQSNTLGWVREWIAFFPDASKCRIVFIENTAEQSKKILGELTRLGLNLDNICVFDKRG